METPIQLTMLGAAGRMGKAIVRCLLDDRVPHLQLSGAVDRADSPDMNLDAGLAAGAREAGVRLSDDLASVAPRSDVCIDFTQAETTAAIASDMAQWNTAWVIGTTGLNAGQHQAVEQAAQDIPVVMAPNMSLGVNLLFVLVEEAARSLKGRGYDIEIIERHHRRKKDAPSGTAWGLGRAAANGMEWNLDEVARHGRAGIEPTAERPAEQIGFHAVRGGDYVGDHTVLYATDGESIELGHRATSRDTFAIGALQAAAWVHGRTPGLYTMRDVLGL